MQISLDRQSVLGWLIYNVVSNVIRGAYDDCGHFNCCIVDVRFFNFLALCTCKETIRKFDQKYQEKFVNFTLRCVFKVF